MNRFLRAGNSSRYVGSKGGSQLTLDLLLVFLFAVPLATPFVPSIAMAQEELTEENPSALPDSLAFELLRMLAREDTAKVPQINYVLGEFVEAKDERPTLKEIIGWCIESEENRFTGLEDAQFRRRYRSIEFYGDAEDDDARRILTEEVEQVYMRPPDEIVEVSLGERTWDSEEAETDEDLEVEIDSVQRDLSSLPVFFQELDDYDFSILDRRIFSDRILYKIAFEPRSAFAALPEGWFLVDTARFQILRAEYKMMKNLPYPVFLKSIDRVSIQRRENEGFWFVEDVQVEITMNKLIVPLPIPRRIELHLQIEDLRVNEGIPDSVWVNQ